MNRRKRTANSGPVGRGGTGPAALVVAGLFVVALAAAATAADSTPSTSLPSALSSERADREFVPREVIVRFEPGVRERTRASVLRAEGAVVEKRLQLPGAVLVRLSRGQSVAEAAEEFERHPEVRYAEPNRLHKMHATPSDARFGELWGLHQPSDADIDAPQAWDLTPGSSNVVVAVVDTGVAYNHPDLAPNIWTNDDPPDGVDNDANGRIDDTRGWDFVGNDNAPLDVDGHGTHVAGTIGAEGNNGVGVAGVNWDVSLMALRACCDGDGFFPTDAIVDAFGYACANGADVVNGSFGSNELDAPVRDAILACPNMLFVFSAGNDGADLDGTGAAFDSYPCELHRPPTSAPNVICVAATDRNDQLASFSNHGASAVHLAAPGSEILSTSAYETIWGPDGFDDATDTDFNTRWGDRTSTAGDKLWGRATSLKDSGTHSLTDSPAGDYAADTSTTIRRLDAFSLTGKARCSIHYAMRLDTEFDLDSFSLFGGATPATPTSLDSWSGSTDGSFVDVSSDLSMFDGEPTVYVRFRLDSDDIFNFDGVYVDEVSVKCLEPGGTDYESLDGTSMAAPHVVGAAALLLAQNPARTVGELKTLLTSSTDALASLSDATVAGGRLNACKALGRLAAECGGPPPPPPPPQPPAPEPPAPEPPAPQPPAPQPPPPEPPPAATPPPPLAPPPAGPPPIGTPPARCVVPNVKGRTVVRARGLLSRRRCRLGRVGRAYSRRVKKSKIVSQSRRPGVRLARGTRVNVVVSRGRRR
jgi:subtilisin family serine protease